MSVKHVPVITWRDTAGLFTCATLEGAESAVGTTARDAEDQIKDFLQWGSEHNDIVIPDELEAVQLNYFSVKVQAEYRESGRIYPCADAIKLRVACVTAERADGTKVAVLPFLDQRFYYHDDAALRQLIDHYVQERLDGQTTEEILYFLPPPEIALSHLAVRVKAPRDSLQHDAGTQLLHQVAELLDSRAARKRYAHAWFREAQTEALRDLISKGANVLLVGDSGVGKTTVVAGVVRLLSKNEPDVDDATGAAKKRRRLWLTRPGQLIAGMKYLGQWEQRCEEIIAELQDTGGVLCVDSLLDLIVTGGATPATGLAAFFAQFIRSRDMTLVTEATPETLAACRRLLPSFVELFQIIHVPPFDESQALALLEKLSEQYTNQYRLDIERGALNRVYRLFRRFMPYRAFPGSLIRFLRDNFAAARRAERKSVKASDLTAAFSRQTGLPDAILDDNLPLAFGDIVAELRTRVIGQPEACESAARVIAALKAGLNDPQRPVGVMLFCGPTGVGKTELARAIATYLFQKCAAPDRRLIRLDMSEYSDGNAAARLTVRSTPGGTQPSEFLRRVREEPFCVVLFDEIEKAAPDVFDMLLTAFDEGRMTDPYGRVTTFRSALLIMTSNLGAEQRDRAGLKQDSAPEYAREVRAFFRPELFNRLDAVVSFHALSAGTIEAITEKELTEIAAREGFVRRGLKLSWTPDVVANVARIGFDKRFGARPLQRALEQQIVSPLARLLAEDPTCANRTVRIGLAATATGGFTFAISADSLGATATEPRLV